MSAFNLYLTHFALKYSVLLHIQKFECKLELPVKLITCNGVFVLPLFKSTLYSPGPLVLLIMCYPYFVSYSSQ